MRDERPGPEVRGVEDRPVSKFEEGDLIKWECLEWYEIEKIGNVLEAGGRILEIPGHSTGWVYIKLRGFPDPYSIWWTIERPWIPKLT